MSRQDDLNSVFPLPLAPYEYVMFKDDRGGHPMTCAAEFTFLGSVNRDALETALHQATRRHPLFMSVVRTSQGGKLNWVFVDRTPPLIWLDQDQHDVFTENHPIDLTVELGLRVSVVCESEVTRLRFDFHHACCDAAGGMGFVEDLLVCYVRACDRHSPISLRPLDVTSLRHRARLRAGSQTLWARTQGVLAAVRSVFGHLCRTPLALAASVKSDGRAAGDWQSCRYVVRRYEEDEIRGLRHRASDRDMTVNDLLLQKLFGTLHDWQLRQGIGTSRRDLRVVIPVNLREKDDAQMPALNKIGYTFVSCGLSDADDELRVLDAIRRASHKSHRFCSAQRFLHVINVMARMPNSIFAQIFGEHRCHATAIFTNIGDPTRRFIAKFPRDKGRLVVGDLILDSITSIGPIRPNTRAVFSVNTYANRLTMSARCDPQYFSPTDAAELLQELAERALGSSLDVELVAET